MNCPKCNQLLNIDMSYVGTPLNQPRKGSCSKGCGRFEWTPTTGEIKEIANDS